MKSILVVVTLSTFAAHAATETKEFGLNDISKIEFKNTSGNLNITAVSKGKAIVTAEKKEFGDSCKLNIDKKGKTLVVEVQKESGFFKSDCRVNFTITVPKTAALALDSGEGKVSVTGTSGDLSFNVGSGSVDVNAEVKELEGKIGSGNIIINGATSGGNLKAGSGNIEVIYKSAPSKGELDIKSGSGNAEVTLPKKSKILTSFVAGSGRLTNELGDTPDSSFKVSMKAGSGNLHIKKQ